MNVLFTLGKGFDFMTPSDSARKLEMQNFGFTTALCQFDVLSCGVLPESGGVGTPAETSLTMGKELKEFQLCDSRRLCKKEQDAQDDVIKLFDLFDARFLGVGKVYRIWTPKAVLPSSAHGCLCHPYCLLWLIVFGELLKLGAFRASCRNPKNRVAIRSNLWIWCARFWSRLLLKVEIENSLGMALSTAKSGSAWQSHFWQCGTLRAALDTKLFT